MGAPSSQQLVARLELSCSLQPRQKLVVLDHVLAALEVPPAVLVVGALLFGRHRLEVGLREFVAAEVDATGSGDLVDRTDGQVDPVFVNLYRLVHQIVDGVSEGVFGGHIGLVDGLESKKSILAGGSRFRQRWPTPSADGIDTLVHPRNGQRGKNDRYERVTDLYERVLERFDEHPDRVSFPVSRNR